MSKPSLCSSCASTQLLVAMKPETEEPSSALDPNELHLTDLPLQLLQSPLPPLLQQSFLTVPIWRPPSPHQQPSVPVPHSRPAVGPPPSLSTQPNPATVPPLWEVAGVDGLAKDA